MFASGNAISSKKQELFLSRCDHCRTFFTSAISLQHICPACLDAIREAHADAIRKQQAHFAYCAYCGDYAYVIRGTCSECREQREADAAKAHDLMVCPEDCPYCNLEEFDK